MKYLYLLFFIIILSINACTQEAPLIAEPTAPMTVDSTRIWKHFVSFVPISPRIAGYKTHQEAVDYLVNALKKEGINCEMEIFEDYTPIGKKTFCNVIGEIKGKDASQFILLGSHFDTKDIPNFVGANDSGSSTAVLLELLRILKNHPPRYSIRFAFFDGEECHFDYNSQDGLHGSRYHAKEMEKENLHKQCKAMILMDLIGDKNLELTLPSDTHPDLARLVRKLAPKDLIKNYNSILDDHVPFMQLGIPCINLIDFSYGVGNRLWHTEYDTIENCDIRSMQTVGNLVLKLIHHIK